ncbi:nucleotidyltransferase domain-containing protein [Salisaeta longa]|uniref:nucleotidyltransferase domain-containing protein n=1 Tax=Salisaeta longa TaxID=503170 RepID=UPI000688B25B|nr:nucleotidyltransferase domain-containing protein [Salisaeta longa]
MDETVRTPLGENFPSPTATHVREVVRRLVEAFDPLRIVVFGSYARGEARPGSDLDILVVLPSVDNTREAAIAMRHELADLAVPNDVVVTTPDEIKRRGWIIGTVLREALKDGSTVYERAEAE